MRLVGAIIVDRICIGMGVSDGCTNSQLIIHLAIGTNGPQTPLPPLTISPPTTGVPAVAPALPSKLDPVQQQTTTPTQAPEQLAVASGGNKARGGGQNTSGIYGTLRDLEYYQGQVRINPPPFQLPPNLGSSQTALDAVLAKFLGDTDIPFDPASYDALAGIEGQEGDGGDDPSFAHWQKDLDGKLSSYNSALTHLE